MSDPDREQFFDDAAEVTPLVGVKSDSGRFIVPTGDRNMGRMLFTRAERGEMRTLVQATRAIGRFGGRSRVGGTIIDVGANIGTTTLAALNSGPFESAVACEPDPGNFRLLRANVILNELDDAVTTLPVAVSDAAGAGRLAIHPRNSGGHRLMVAGPSRNQAAKEGQLDKVGVERVTLDYLVERGLANPERTGLLWIDVQGHEGHVLNGAARFLEPGVPLVLELHPRLLDSTSRPLVEDLLIEHYSHVIDLRRRSTRAVGDIRALIDGLESDHELTDVLAVRRRRRLVRRRVDTVTRS